MTLVYLSFAGTEVARPKYKIAGTIITSNWGRFFGHFSSLLRQIDIIFESSAAVDICSIKPLTQMRVSGTDLRSQQTSHGYNVHLVCLGCSVKNKFLCALFSSTNLIVILSESIFC